jgi:hypothetical protein
MPRAPWKQGTSRLMHATIKSVRPVTYQFSRKPLSFLWKAQCRCGCSVFHSFCMQAVVLAVITVDHRCSRQRDASWAEGVVAGRMPKARPASHSEHKVVGPL